MSGRILTRYVPSYVDQHAVCSKKTNQKTITIMIAVYKVLIRFISVLYPGRASFELLSNLHTCASCPLKNAQPAKFIPVRIRHPGYPFTYASPQRLLLLINAVIRTVLCYWNLKQDPLPVRLYALTRSNEEPT